MENEQKLTPVQELYNEIKAKSKGAFGHVTIADVALITSRILLKEKGFAESCFNAGVQSKNTGEDNFETFYNTHNNETTNSTTASNAGQPPQGSLGDNN